MEISIHFLFNFDLNVTQTQYLTQKLTPNVTLTQTKAHLIDLCASGLKATSAEA